MLQLVTAFLGSLGFALLFGLQHNKLFWASFGVFLSWGIYLAVFALTKNIFFSYLSVSIVSMLYSEFMARWCKCPTTIFTITAIIPLVPGSSLYYAMSYAVNGDRLNAEIYAPQTMIWVLAISAGISFTTAIHELRSRR